VTGRRPWFHTGARAAALLGGTWLLACSPEGGAPAAPARPPEARPTIGVSYQALRFPFVAALQRAARGRAEALSVRLLEADAGNDASTELANVENLLGRGIDCLAFEATSLDASSASIEAANARGVPVVQFNGKANGGRWVTFVGSEQAESGDLLGRWLVGFLRASGRERVRGIYLRGVSGQVTDTARNDALKARLDREGFRDRIELLEQFADYDRGRGQAVTESLLASHPELDFILANNDDMILGALEAVEARGLGRSVALVGVDGLPETLARIAEGRIAATVFQNPEGQGAGAVQACVDHLAGKALPPEILIPFELVTRENVERISAIARRVYGAS
jgi:ABC-type sugar transport system substrate-binding protein